MGLVGAPSSGRLSMRGSTAPSSPHELPITGWLAAPEIGRLPSGAVECKRAPNGSWLTGCWKGSFWDVDFFIFWPRVLLRCKGGP